MAGGEDITQKMSFFTHARLDSKLIPTKKSLSDRTEFQSATNETVNQLSPAKRIRLEKPQESKSESRISSESEEYEIIESHQSPSKSVSLSDCSLNKLIPNALMPSRRSRSPAYSSSSSDCQVLSVLDKLDEDTKRSINRNLPKFKDHFKYPTDIDIDFLWSVNFRNVPKSREVYTSCINRNLIKTKSKMPSATFYITFLERIIGFEKFQKTKGFCLFPSTNEAIQLAKAVKQRYSELSRQISGCICNQPETSYVNSIHRFVNAQFDLVSLLQTILDSWTKKEAKQKDPHFYKQILTQFNACLTIPTITENICSKDPLNEGFQCALWTLHALKASIPPTSKGKAPVFRQKVFLRMLLDQFPPHLLPKIDDVSINNDYDIFDLVCRSRIWLCNLVSDKDKSVAKLIEELNQS